MSPDADADADADAPAYLVRGDDPVLVAQAGRGLIERLVGGRDPTLVVEEHGGGAADDLDIGAVIDACTTPPFLVDRRVVVVRDAGRLGPSDGARLVRYLADPLPSTVLVLMAGGGTVPQAVVKAVGGVGVVRDSSAGTGRDRRTWTAEQLREAPVRLDGPAAARLAEHLGDDLGRLAGIVRTLAAAYGEGATVGAHQLEPYLGEAGAVPPWDLTDAVDAGATATALAALRRMQGPGGRAAPQVIAVLHNHYSGMLALDGSGVTSGEEALPLLGTRSVFVAKKTLGQSRSLGGANIGRAITMLADADLDVKGASGLDPDLVLEVLVARLSRLTPRRAPAGRGAPGGGP